MTTTSQRLKAVQPTVPLADLRRASEIVQILVEHGFGYLLDKTTLATVGAPAQGKSSELPPAQRALKVLEALGPTFVKLGQILSTRADIVPPEFAQAFRTLQDRAEPLPFDQVKTAVEAELGGKLEELFATFETAPLATASIAQVHRATLVRGGQTLQVVCKVQRPGIRQKMRSDLSLLYWLAKALEGTIEEVSAYSPTSIVEQFERAVEEELDFIHERENLERAGRNFGARTHLVVVPQAITERSSPRVLTMTFLSGVKITDTRDDPRYDRTALRDRLVEATYCEVFEDGFFHGDPHPGNVLVLEDGRIGFLDFGLWGQVTREQQDSLVQWLTAIVLKSPPTLARLTLKIGQVGPGFDRQAYERDIARLMDKYVGVAIEDLSSQSIIADSVEAIRKHRIKLPPDFAILARATATLEGVVRHLFPDLDFQAVAAPYVQRLLLRRLTAAQMGPEAIGLFLGMQDFVQEVPSQINQLLHDLSTGRFRMSVTGESLDELAAVGRAHGMRLVLALLACTWLIAVAITLAPFQYTAYGVPVVPVLMGLGALMTWGGLLVTIFFPKGFQKIRLSRLLFWRRSG